MLYRFIGVFLSSSERTAANRFIAGWPASHRSSFIKAGTGSKSGNGVKKIFCDALGLAYKSLKAGGFASKGE
jgi:hypothetical protein